MKKNSTKSKITKCGKYLIHIHKRLISLIYKILLEIDESKDQKA